MRYVCYACYAVLLFSILSCQATKAGIQGAERGIVPAPRGNYDLNALGVIVEPEKIEVGSVVILKASFDNRGRTAIPKKSFHAELFVNGEREFIDYEPGPIRVYQASPAKINLEPPSPERLHYKIEGSTLSYQIVFTPPEPGTYHYEFVLDRADDRPETNETNNVVEGTFVVVDSGDGSN